MDKKVCDTNKYALVNLDMFGSVASIAVIYVGKEG